MNNKKIIGWREWVALPELGINKIKVKVDTGARTSCLHADGLKLKKKNHVTYASFKIHPLQRNLKVTKKCRAKVVDFRRVKSSSGHIELRPVIITHVKVLDETFPIEITLTNRDEMGFRMLLGRESFRRRMLVDAGSSYYGKRLLKKQLKARRASKKTALKLLE